MRRASEGEGVFTRIGWECGEKGRMEGGYVYVCQSREGEKTEGESESQG